MNERIRLTALLCAFMLVFCTAMSGCAQKVKFEEKTTTRDNKIKINTVDTDIPDGSSIVIGDDGQSYLVDGEGNSVVYEAPSTYVIPDTKTTTTTTKATTKTTKTTKPIKTIPAPSTTETTTSQQDKVIGILRSKRQNIDYNLGDLNSNVETLDFEFNSGGKEWCFKFAKGKYDTTTIGCETCIYLREERNWRIADDALLNKVSITLWHEIDDENVKTSTESKSASCGWTSIIENGNLPGGNYNALTMKSVIAFSNNKLADDFCNALEDNGFEENSTTDYNTPNRFSVSGNTVTIIWN